MAKNSDPSSGWVPEFTLDLNKATGQGFSELVEEFHASTKAMGEIKPTKLKNGWLTITPQMAEMFLRFNRPGANRKLELVTVMYYASQMKAEQWPKTGQGIVFDEDGWLQDGQHRLWACYLGRVSFDSYVVADVPVIPNLFAYLDNSRTRTASVALQTAGLNGLSPLISQTIQVAHNFELGIYTCQAKKQRTAKMPPIQYLHYVDQHPEVRRAAHLTASEYREATEAIGHKGITSFIVYKIITLHDEDVCDRFMEQISLTEEAEDETLKALNAFLLRQSKSKDPLPKHLVLAHVIKAFNAWTTQTVLKRVALPSDDPFPQFVEPGQSTSEELL